MSQIHLHMPPQCWDSSYMSHVSPIKNKENKTKQNVSSWGSNSDLHACVTTDISLIELTDPNPQPKVLQIWSFLPESGGYFNFYICITENLFS